MMKEEGAILDPLTASLVDSETIFLLNKTDIAVLDGDKLASVTRRLGLHNGDERVFPISVDQQEGLRPVSTCIMALLEKKYIRSFFSRWRADEAIQVQRRTWRNTARHARETSVPFRRVFAVSHCVLR